MEAVTVGLVSIWFVLGAVAGLLAAVLEAALWVQIVLFFVDVYKRQGLMMKTCFIANASRFFKKKLQRLL